MAAVILVIIYYCVSLNRSLSQTLHSSKVSSSIATLLLAHPILLSLPRRGCWMDPAFPSRLPLLGTFCSRYCLFTAPASSKLHLSDLTPPTTQWGWAWPDHHSIPVLEHAISAYFLAHFKGSNSRTQSCHLYLLIPPHTLSSRADLPPLPTWVCSDHLYMSQCSPI